MIPVKPLFTLLLLLLACSYSQGREDRIAVLYLHAADTDPGKLLNTRQLEQIILAEDGPCRRHWKVAAGTGYTYRGKVFSPIALPVTEAELDPGPGLHFLSDRISKVLEDQQLFLSVPGFSAEDYDRLILILGSNSLFSAGRFLPRFAEEVVLRINGQAVRKGVICPVYLSSQDSVPSSLLHQWGHSLGLGHANVLYHCPEDHQQAGDCSSGNRLAPYELMGTMEEQVVNPGLLEAAGLLPSDRILSLQGRSGSFRLPAFGSDPARPDAGMLRIGKRLPCPRQVAPMATAEPVLYLTYRPSSHNSSRGLLIHQRLTSPASTAPHLPRSNLRSIANNTWLLDLHPQPGLYHLPPGWTFYHDDWQIRVGEVQQTTAQEVSFQLGEGDIPGLETGLYPTALANGNTLAGPMRPLLYSSDLSYYLMLLEDGRLVVRNTTNGQAVWDSHSAGIPLTPSAQQLSLYYGFLSLQDQAGKTLWTTWTQDTSPATECRLIISSEGLPEVRTSNGKLQWRAPAAAPLPSAEANQNWVFRTVADGLGNNNANGFATDGRLLVVGTGKGISISYNDGKTFVTRSLADGLGAEYVHDVFIHRGIICAGTDNGLSISYDDGHSFINLGPETGLAHPSVIGVFATDDAIYAGTLGGVSVSRDGGRSFITFTEEDNNLIHKRVIDIYAQGDTIFAPTFEGLSISYDGGECFSSYSLHRSDGKKAAIYEVIARGENVYAATGAGLIISNDGGRTFMLRDTSHGLPAGAVFGVAERDGILLAGTSGGLAVSYDKGQHFKILLSENNVQGGLAYDGRAIYAPLWAGGLGILHLHAGMRQ